MGRAVSGTEFEDQIYHEPGEDGPHDPEIPPNTNSPRQARDARKRAKLVEENRIATARTMLAYPASREFLAWIVFQLAGMNKPTIDPTASSPISQFRAGQRDVALHLHRLLQKADKSAYLVLLSEHMD